MDSSFSAIDGPATASATSRLIDDAPPMPAYQRLLGPVLVGILASCLAVGIRAALPLESTILPFFTVVIVICVVTATRGLAAGVAAMLSGGLLTSFFVLSPGSWTLTKSELLLLIGYFGVASVIVATSELYRRTEATKRSMALEVARQQVEQEQIFAGEMAHRLKNAMAIVQAIATQTFPRDTPELDKFERRLRALAGAHNLLMDHAQRPTASVREVIAEAMRPFESEGSRLQLGGPELILPAQQVVSLALALHELATNAIKYGAWAASDGSVSILWEKRDNQLTLTWTERGGPPVSAPEGKGFGTKLLTRAAMGGELEFDPAGLRCTIVQSF